MGELLLTYEQAHTPYRIGISPYLIILEQLALPFSVHHLIALP